MSSSSSASSSSSPSISSWSESYQTTPTTPAFPRDRPLIEYCTNEWLKNSESASPTYSPTYGHDRLPEGFIGWLDDWADEVILVIKAPRFRRLLIGLSMLVIALIFLFVHVLGPWIEEERILWQSVTLNAAKSVDGLFGSSHRPHFAGMKFIRDMDPRYLPSKSDLHRRLIFVGDIHGCKTELLALMDKVNFRPETDHLIAVGDVVNKGPDTPGVIDFLMANNASCVRGNHEDSLLLMANDVASPPLHAQNGKSYHVGKPKDNDPFTKLIRQLSQEQLNWLQSLPLVLKVGNIKGIGNIIVVHAGLVPGVPLDSQDPFSVMNMRTIDLASHVPSKFHGQQGAVPWFRLWSRYQILQAGHQTLKSLSRKRTVELNTPAFVVYGHDAKMGLQTGQYYRGLDSGCVGGGSLTAFVVSGNGKQEIVQVPCSGYITHKKKAQ